MFGWFAFVYINEASHFPYFLTFMTTFSIETSQAVYSEIGKAALCFGNPGKGFQDYNVKLQSLHLQVYLF